MREVLLSVGIDIGTTTTQLVFSEIVVEDLSGDFSVPRVEIVDRSIIFRSEIFFTPLKSPVEIDAEKVRDMVASQYAAFGKTKSDVNTGAVLITGETARKNNADEVLRAMSDLAGDFVVATAGPDLESIIAGRGAGADVFSRRNGPTANYDIGGGTSNYVLFKDGEVAATGCMDIGGRLVKLDETHRRIAYIAPKVQALCERRGISLAVGDEASVPVLQCVAQAMAEMLEMSLGLREKDDIYPLMLTGNKDIPLDVPVRYLGFSGGVADSVYTEPQGDVFRYGDIGILLGQAIAQSAAFSQVPRFVPQETIRATVVGAGTHVTEISGSTIDFDESLLPIKNLPILKLSRAEETDENTVAVAVKEKLSWFVTDGEQQLAAIAFKGERSPSYAQVSALARGIVQGAQPLLQKNMPLIIISEADMAKVLGQTLKMILPAGTVHICVDAVRVDNGDYIDIGKPIASAGVLPVVIKTLVFDDQKKQ